MFWNRKRPPAHADAKPQNYTEGYRHHLRERWSGGPLKLYLIAAAPKSGSTWCAEFLASYLKCPSIFAGKVPGRMEQDLDDAWLSHLGAGQTAVIHQHCRYHQATQAYIDVLEIKPMPLMRNVFDSVPSIRDHLKAKGGNWPFGFVDRAILDQPDAAIDAFIAHHIMPWYFNFAIGWLSSPFPVMTYERIFSDPEAGAVALLTYFEIEIDQTRLERALGGLDGSRTRLNVGVTGRGELLDETTKAHLMRLAAHYRHYDLRPLGFPTP